MPGVGGAGDFYSFQVWCSLGGGSEMGILGLLSVLTGCTQCMECEQEVAGLGISYHFKPGARESGKGLQYFFYFLFSLSFFQNKIPSEK